MRLEPSQIKQILMYVLPAAGVFLFALGMIAVKRFTKPVLTPEQEEQARLDEIEKQIYKVILAEAADMVKKIPYILANMNSFKSYRRIKPGPLGKKLIVFRFDVAMVTKTEIWISFNDWKGFPQGTGYDDLLLVKNNVIDNLEFSLKRQVKWHEVDKYLFLRIGLKYALNGIPKIVAWSVAFNALPKTNPFALAVGMNERGNIVHNDFRRWPHILVTGTSQYGKTTQLMQWLITLISRNGPDVIQFILVDLKEGAEFERFVGVPHVLDFVQEEDQVVGKLVWLIKEYEERMVKIKGQGCSNILAYNKKSYAKLPYIILIIDELADLMMEIPDDLKELIEEMTSGEKGESAAIEKGKKKKKLSTSQIATAAMMILARKARAAGIHLMLCTQILEAKVLPMQIRGNINGRLSFALPGIDESRLALNNALATTLEIPGRCVYKIGADHVILQAPIATDQEIAEVIQAAISAPVVSEPPEYKLFRYSVNGMDGLANVRELWNVTNGEWSFNKVQSALKTYTYDFEKQEPIIDIDEQKYILAPGFNAGNKGMIPRMFISVNGHIPTRDEAKEISLSRYTGNGKLLPQSTPDSDEEE